MNNYCYYGDSFLYFAPTILFFEIQNDTGKGIINVTLAYLIGQYLKVYGLPKNMKRHSWDILSGALPVFLY